MNRLAAPGARTRESGAQTLSSAAMGSADTFASVGLTAPTGLAPTRPPGAPGARVAPARVLSVEAPTRTFDYASHDEADFARRKRVPLVACGSLAALAVLTAFLIGHRGDDGARASAAQVAEGAVIGRTTPADARSGTPAAVAAAVAAAPPAPRSGNKPPIASNFAAVAGAPTSSASKSASGARPDVAASLASARAYLDQNRLAAAHAVLARVLAVQPGNDAAQRMRAELATREQDRDALLAYAHRCGRAGQWGCVRHDAARALAIDASSREAKWWLARAANERSVRYENASSARDQQDADMMPRELPVWSHH